MVFYRRLLWWHARVQAIIVDMDNALELDGYISMDTCALHRHIFNWVMFMDRGILLCFLLTLTI